MTKKEIEFLKEYKELCKKYGLIIGACGCCNSPWICKRNKMAILEHIKHLIDEKNKNIEDEKIYKKVGIWEYYKYQKEFCNESMAD